MKSSQGSGFRVQGSKGLVFVLSGPSGSGKTTLLQHLLKDKLLEGKLKKSVSLTTRSKRSGERQGRDYFFLSPEEFERLRKAKKILEWTKYLGYYYATPKVFIRQHINKGRHLGLCLDLKGAQALKKLFPRNTVTIFILPPCLKVLKKRIQGRCHRTKPAEIHRRMLLAEKEMLAHVHYDYALVNKNLTQTVKALRGIVLNKIAGLINTKEGG